MRIHIDLPGFTFTKQGACWIARLWGLQIVGIRLDSILVGLADE